MIIVECVYFFLKFSAYFKLLNLLFDILTGNDETVREIRSAGGKAYGYQVDVSSRENIYEIAQKVKEEVGKVEILINNAGVVSGKKFLEIPDAMIEKTMVVNTMSNFWVRKP